jgi:hypothetical protein
LYYFDRYQAVPFYKEELDLYVPRLEEVINMMLEIELPLLRGLDLAYVHKIKQLFIINSILPFIPNVSKLSGINDFLLLYFHYWMKLVLLSTCLRVRVALVN